MSIPFVSNGIMEIFTQKGLKMFVDWLRDLSTADGKPRHLSDTEAQPDTVYYSTTTNKLTYKDSLGTTHALY